jgi:putative oxidoreductase
MTIIPASFRPNVQALLRIIIGLVFLQHGLAKLIDFPHMDGLSQMPMALKWTAGIIETVGGLALLVGFQTRIAAFVMSGFAAAAYFMVHAPMGFFPALNFGEAALLLSFASLFLAVGGAGTWAIDRTSPAAA